MGQHHQRHIPKTHGAGSLQRLRGIQLEVAAQPVFWGDEGEDLLSRRQILHILKDSFNMFESRELHRHLARVDSMLVQDTTGSNLRDNWQGHGHVRL